MRQGRIERDGASIAYEVWDADRPADAPLVFLPGWACDRSGWRETARRIQGRRTCLLIDLAGAGDSPIINRASQTLEALARDVVAVMAEEGLQRAVLVGHSMGGAVALEAAALVPERVVAVIGVDSLIYPAIYDGADGAVAEGALSAFRQDFAGVVRASMEGYIYPGAGETLARAQLDAMATADPDQVLPVMEDFIRWDVTSALNKTDVPVAVIGATRLQPEGHSSPLASRIQLFWVDEVGHFIMVEDPEAFHARLDQALAAVCS